MTSEGDQDAASEPASETRTDSLVNASWQPLDEEGRERPRFLAGFPRHPQLDGLVDAFCTGNFARIRREAPRLAVTTTDPVVRSAALELYRRIQPDPVVLALLALSLGLLVWIVVWAY